MLNIIRRIGEHSARALAIMALFVAFRPGDALADNSAVEGSSISSEDVALGTDADISVEGEDDPPPAAD